MTTTRRTVALVLGSLALSVGLAASAQAQTKLRVFSGGTNQRPDLMRKIFDQYQTKYPGVTIEMETGGATSDLQRQYLSTCSTPKTRRSTSS